MIVFLDSTALISDYHLVSTQFNILIESKSKLGIKLCVSRLVLDETVNKYRENLESYAKKVKKAQSDFSRLTKKDIEISNIPNVDNLTNEYRKYLTNYFEKNDTKIVEIPDVSIEDIIKRDLNRKKPFSGSSGYRDYLIWRSIVSSSYISSQREIVFISNNKSDFASGQELHQDLKEELNKLNVLNTNRFKYFPNIKAFNEKYVLPNLNLVKDINNELNKHGLEHIDILKWVKDNLNYILIEEDLLILGADLEPYMASAGSANLIRPPSLEVKNIYKLPNSNIVLIVELKLEVEYEIDIEWDEYVKYDRVKEIAGGPVQSFEWISVEWNNGFNVELELVLDVTSQQIESFDVSSIEAQYLF